MKIIFAVDSVRLIKIVNCKESAEKYKTLSTKDNSKIICITGGVDTFAVMAFIGDFLIMDYVMALANMYRVKEKLKKEIGIWVCSNEEC